MHAQFRKLILAASIAMAMGNVTAAESQSYTDTRQESQIWTTYALSPDLRANDLKVLVRNGKATLSGMVADEVH